MNNIYLLFIFTLREGAGNTRIEFDEVELLEACLHLIE